jgi:hypothetical protein
LPTQTPPASRRTKLPGWRTAEMFTDAASLKRLIVVAAASALAATVLRGWLRRGDRVASRPPAGDLNRWEDEGGALVAGQSQPSGA